MFELDITSNYVPGRFALKFMFSVVCIYDLKNQKQRQEATDYYKSIYYFEIFLHIINKVVSPQKPKREVASNVECCFMSKFTKKKNCNSSTDDTAK